MSEKSFSWAFYEHWSFFTQTYSLNGAESKKKLSAIFSEPFGLILQIFKVLSLSVFCWFLNTRKKKNIWYNPVWVQLEKACILMVSLWFKTQHLIWFQVILPLLFDFTVRRHIYQTTTTVYAIHLEKTPRLWSFIYLLLSICRSKTTRSLTKLNGYILCLGRSYDLVFWIGEIHMIITS